jgi:hypothetical protein
VLSREQIEEAARLFAQAGYREPLQTWPVTSDDERIFVVAEAALAGLPPHLIQELQDALHRKVWIVPPRKADPSPEPLR